MKSFQGLVPHFPLKRKHVPSEVAKSLWSSQCLFSSKLPFQGLHLAQDLKFSAKFVVEHNSSETKKYSLYLADC